ncbi:MAG: hypothetical protein ACE15D_05925 [Candidatus Eisenbacteria bacterium]|nr:hypothetical protein [Candidatus Eisenbacteria bacterium]
MREIDIPRAGWNEFLPAFAQMHSGWLVEVATVGAGARVRPLAAGPPAEPLALEEIRVRDRDELADVTLRLSRPPREGGGPSPKRGGPEDSEAQISVPGVVRVVLERDDEGVDAGLQLLQGSGSVASIRFRVALRPEMLDGA